MASHNTTAKKLQRKLQANEAQAQEPHTEPKKKHPSKPQANEAQAQASREAGGYNRGTQGSFNNRGSGAQNFGDVNYNSGSHSGNRYNSPYYHNAAGGNFVHNSGTTYGDRNGCINVNNGR
ncbi:eukaryotic peptide chain release factor GTP-binding subunit-like [Neltuma alba]|uniref:eukaryotic peptide chain release factor GTP-binding subunit-like n=1 Tax=Neltuma alba TaxID=207710 RepID=UPI0010A4302D|nr:eukaryotic peptide chain release factor GTP-binding subunit-like [Prosopis alba]